MSWTRFALAGAAALGAAVLLTRRTPASPAGKVVVITGGSRGLGLVLAREYARRGAIVALVARDSAELDRAAGELRANGATVSTWPMDLTQGDGCERLLEQVSAAHGAVDILVNNAGEISVGPFECFTHDDFHRSLAIHLWAPLRLTQSAIPLMRRQGGGRIVNISSIGGCIPVPHLSAYCAGKHALTGFSGTMRAELSWHGISVTTVNPGLMRTGSHWNARFKGNHRAEFAWFGHGASVPGVSIAAERAARQIVDATQRGDAELTITWQAKAATRFAAIAPRTFAALNAFVARRLPRVPAEGGTQPVTGWESASKWMPSWFTRFGDRATARNNELRGHRPPA